MPPEITETKEQKPSEQKSSNFWVWITVVVLVVIVGFIIYFSRDKSFKGYSDEERQEFLKTTKVSDTPIYTDEERETFSKTTKVSDTPVYSEEERKTFLESTQVIN